MFPHPLGPLTMPDISRMREISPATQAIYQAQTLYDGAAGHGGRPTLDRQEKQKQDTEGWDDEGDLRERQRCSIETSQALCFLKVRVDRKSVV